MRTRERLVVAVAMALTLAACGTTLHDPVQVTGPLGDERAADVPDGGELGLSTDPGPPGIDPGSSAAGGTGSAGGGATGAAVAGAAGQMNSDPIAVGFVVTETGNAGALGIATGQTFSHRQAVEALVRSVNAEGGLAGRKIQPVIDGTDTASVSWEADYASACAAFTQDNQVEAVLGYTFAFIPSFESCLNSAGVTHLTNAYNIGDDASFSQYPHLFSLSNPTLDRVYATLLTGSARYGRVTAASKIGVVMTECAVDVRAWNGAGVPTAKRLGLNVSNIERISCPTGSASVGTVITQLQNAVLKFRSAGVDTVIVEGPPMLIFSAAAESQGWHPKYLASTLTGGAALPGNMPEAQVVNVNGIGWFSAIDVAGSRQPTRTPSQERCIGLLRSGGLSPSGYNDLVTAYTTCDALFLYEAALKATRGNSDAAAITSAIEAMGDSYQSASALDGRVRLQRGRHDVTIVARPWAWDAGCTCFTYTSDPGFTMP
jgi:ABC-type branched-subunit amino acid transport system substrate-binding protein